MTNKLLFATSNLGKEREIKRIISGLDGWRLFFLDGFEKKFEAPEENGRDFAENSNLKARFYKKRFPGYFVAAEDSGLVVPSLNGAPGVFSARYKGLAEDGLKVAAILEEMKGFQDEKRNAYFEAVITLILPGGGEHAFSGKIEGAASTEARGENGFGYDPIFIPEGKKVTFAQMPPEEKDELSHRKRALMKLKEFLLDAE